MLQDVASPSWEIRITLPQEAVVPVAQTETGALYHCEGYELMLQTLPGGDLDATVRELTGYGRDQDHGEDQSGELQTLGHGMDYHGRGRGTGGKSIGAG